VDERHAGRRPTARRLLPLGARVGGAARADDDGVPRHQHRHVQLPTAARDLRLLRRRRAAHVPGDAEAPGPVVPRLPPGPAQEQAPPMRRIGRGVCLLLALSWLLGVYNCGWSSGSPPQSATPPAHEIAVDMTEDVKPLPAPTVVAGVADEERATWPAYDDSVRVDEPALPIHKVPPVYPDLAREKGQQGILWVQTLVRT